MKSRSNLESFEIVRISAGSRDDDNVSDTRNIRALHAVITNSNRSDCYNGFVTSSILLF